MQRRLGRRRPRGLSLGDVVVLLVLIVFAGLLLLMAIPRNREQARLTGCTRNLSQIGFALSLYDQMHGQLPEIGPPAPPLTSDAPPSPGPLKILLDTLDAPDLMRLRDPKRPRGRVAGEVAVPGFVCGSDPNALSGHWPAPVSYRATTGDGPDGSNGPFAPGHAWSLAAIEAHDGLSFTAAFSERLVGSGQVNPGSLTSYGVCNPPVPPGGCPALPDLAAWRDDAGSSWTWSAYRSTLYNHALTPNERPSCIALDGRTAYMGASSGHVGGVNLLLLDGSVSLIRPSIDRVVWREYAAISNRPHTDSAP